MTARHVVTLAVGAIALLALLFVFARSPIPALMIATDEVPGLAEELRPPKNSDSKQLAAAVAPYSEVVNHDSAREFRLAHEMLDRADSLTFPHLIMNDMPLQEAVDILAEETRRMDPEGIGIPLRYEVRPGVEVDDEVIDRITLEVNNVSFFEAIRLFTGVSNTKLAGIDDGVIVIEPIYERDREDLLPVPRIIADATVRAQWPKTFDEAIRRFMQQEPEITSRIRDVTLNYKGVLDWKRPDDNFMEALRPMGLHAGNYALLHSMGIRDPYDAPRLIIFKIRQEILRESEKASASPNAGDG